MPPDPESDAHPYEKGTLARSNSAPLWEGRICWSTGTDAEWRAILHSHGFAAKEESHLGAQHQAQKNISQLHRRLAGDAIRDTAGADDRKGSEDIGQTTLLPGRPAEYTSATS